MSFYTYNKFNVKINNKTVFVNSAQLSIGTNVAPNTTVDEPYANTWHATSSARGTMRMSYYLTGNDPFKRYIELEQNVSPIAIYMGGFEINSGYLRSYSINARPMEPVLINVEMDFFEEIKGDPSKVVAGVMPDGTSYTLHYADLHTENYNNQEIINDIIAVNYTYNANIIPEYVVTDDVNLRNLPVYRVLSTDKRVTTDIVTDSLSGTLPMSGFRIGMTLNFGFPDFLPGQIEDEFYITGVLYQKNMGVQVNDLFTNTFTITQNNTLFAPSITASTWIATPEHPYPRTGEILYIVGENLDTVTSAYIDRYELTDLSYDAEANEIQARIPENALSGYISVKTLGGLAIDFDQTPLEYDNIVIDSFSPTIGITGTTVVIKGHNFYHIDRVLFNNIESNFKWMDKNTIHATVPTGAHWDTIKVIATKKLNHLGLPIGTSANKFLTYPSLVYLDPISGTYGDTIAVTGYGMEEIKEIYFNDIISPSITPVDYYQIDATVPADGDITGPVRAVYQNTDTSSEERTAYTPYDFMPAVAITGVHPPTIQVRDILRISGQNFQEDFLYKPIANDDIVWVNIGGSLQEGTLESDILITCPININAFDGKVTLFRKDGSAVYDSEHSVEIIYDPPEILSIIPNTAYIDDNFSVGIIGRYFFDVTEVRILGIEGSPATALINVYINPSYYQVDKLGNKITINGWVAFSQGLIPGKYSFIVKTSKYGMSTFGPNGNITLYRLPTPPVPVQTPSTITIDSNEDKRMAFL